MARLHHGACVGLTGLALAVASALAGRQVVAGDGYNIAGRIVTESGRPVPGVTVEFTGNLPSQVTGMDGQFSVPVPGSYGEYSVKAQKDGYSLTPAAAKVTISEGNAAADFEAAAGVVAKAKPTLQKGDVILVYGSGDGTWQGSTVSFLIRSADQWGLGSKACYSHAAVYIGSTSGTDYVVEMVSGGWQKSKLSSLTSNRSKADVWRYTTSSSTGSTVASKASCYSGKSYAKAQIEALGKTYLWYPLYPTSSLLSSADSDSGGTKKLICSELAITALNDACVCPLVKYWSQGNSYWTASTNRKRDYTTPNGIWYNCPSSYNKGSLL